MHQALPARGIPPLIKRNTALFAFSQAFMGAGTQLGYGIGPLMVISLTQSASLAGLTVALFGISRFLVAYPVGRITDRHGRKPGIQLGLALGLIGTVAVGVAMLIHAIVALVFGMLIFGMGISAAQQMRVAATDMFPPQQRALALGFVATGSLLGIVISPALMWTAEAAATRLGAPPIALPWLMVPVLIVAGMVLVTLVHPDPREIGINLERYYPGYKADASRGGAEPSATSFSARALWRELPTRLAIVCNGAAQGNMAIVMVLTSLVLAHHGHSLTAITMSHMFHSIGMFGFMIPLGRLADRVGREPVMYPGVATTLVGALFVTFGAQYWSVTLGTFLVGLGWSAANVASTALIADHATTLHRGRAIGVNDSAAGAMTLAAAVVTGPLVEYTGLPAAGIAAALVAAVPLVLLGIAHLSNAERSSA
ncbi:MAG: MFS transporter [Xanthobacteraceae bacterium]